MLKTAAEILKLLQKQRTQMHQLKVMLRTGGLTDWYIRRLSFG